jgi:uncharacterized protein (TIGR01777 family)
MSGKILISGSSGLVGTALLSVLHSKGFEVTRLVRGSASGERQIAWDPFRPLAAESVSGFDGVVHLAGESIIGRWTETKKRRILESRVQGTRNLVAALVGASRRPRVLISGSASGYYGDRGDEVLREDSPSGNAFTSDLCRQWEAATADAATAGIRTVQTRLGVVMSAKGGALQKMLPPFRLGLGGKLGNGHQWFSWIDLQDVVGAILFILENESIRGPVNLVSPDPVTNAEFTRTLASVLSRPAIFPMPAFAARLVFGQMADELLLASQRIEPSKLLANGYRFQKPELRLALSAILNK